MNTLLQKAKEVDAIITSSRDLENKYQLAQREQAFKNLKTAAKEFSTITSRILKHLPIKYIIQSHIITPLLYANERIIQTFAKDGVVLEESNHIQDQPQKMELCESNNELKEEKKQSNSLKLKRSYVEMNKLETAEINMFPLNFLKGIFAYIDYKSVKDDIAIQSASVGHFAVVIFEVKLLY